MRCASFRFQIVTGRQSHIYDNITTSTSDKTTIPHAIPSINQSTWIRSSSVAMQQRGDATQQRDATATPRYTTKIYCMTYHQQQRPNDFSGNMMPPSIKNKNHINKHTEHRSRGRSNQCNMKLDIKYRALRHGLAACGVIFALF